MRVVGLPRPPTGWAGRRLALPKEEDAVGVEMKVTEAGRVPLSLLLPRGVCCDEKEESVC